MSSNIDTVSFCNEVIEDTILANVESCKVCFDGFQAYPAIETLAQIAEHGFEPVIPPPDFMCQDSESYLSNPIAEVIIPRLFNDVMENTQIYLAGSLESARTSLLEPIITTVVSPQICGALDAVGLCPGDDPPKIDTKALEFIQDLFTFIADLGASIPSTPGCADVDDQVFQDVMQDIDVISDAIQTLLDEMPDLINDVTEKLNSTKENLDSGDGPAFPHTEYQFPQKFSNDFVSAIAPPIININGNNFDGTVRGVSSGSFGLRNSILTSDVQYIGEMYSKTIIKLNFGGSNTAKIVYSAYDGLDTFKGVTVQYSIPKVDVPNSETANMASPQYRTRLGTEYEEIGLNPYIYRFVQPILPEMPPVDPLNPNDPVYISGAQADDIVGRHHIWAYGDVMKSTFEYIYDNGAFSQDIINNLKLFKDNKNCTPENIGDLFDADGIIDQMRKEFAAAACHDSGSNQDKVRGSLYFGLINMLIQAIIDEFLISNIIVFSALNMEDVLDPRYPFREVMISYVVSSFNKIILDGNPIVEREIYNYFARVASRPSVEFAGGFTHSYAPTEVVPGFEGSSFPLNNQDLVRFMVEERFGYSWHDGETPRSTLQAINNVIDPAGNKKLFDDFFVGDVVQVLDSQEAIDSFWDNRDFFVPAAGMAAMTTEIDPAIVFYGHEPEYTALMYAPSRPTAYEIFRVLHPPNLSRNDRINKIKQSPDYNLFFNQAINKYACLSMAVLYNFYLVGKHLSDVASSFDSTKRSIIHMFNMTERSEARPALEPRSDEFVNSMANDGGVDMESIARDIILKFLRETPIQILKGLCELIDPHIAISKLIKNFTGAAFNELFKGMQAAMDSGAMPGSAALKDKGITAEDIFGVIFCLYNIANTAGSTAALTSSPANQSSTDNDIEDNVMLLPRLTLDGVDLKGTIAGMFMAPPSPLGIIYLLIELLMLKIDDDLTEGDDAVTDATEPETVECPEGTTPIELV